MPTIDILVITYDRAEYARKTLDRLLSTCTPDMHVWLWHNGQQQDALAVARSYADHPRVARFHHSVENQRLRGPTNWLWERTSADFVSKIDDDCLVEPGWAEKLGAAHQLNPQFGVIGSWRFYDEDFEPAVAARKLEQFNGVTLLRNLWVQGSGYLMKRQCIAEQGLLQPDQSFSRYCIDLARRGYINGWYFPFIHEEHMDDPRSLHTELRSDDDLHRRLPLSAANLGISSLQEWEQQMRRSAAMLQRASLDPRDHVGTRARLRRAWRRISSTRDPSIG